MRVAVTGSSGLIGSAVVRRLNSAGHQVIGVVRTPSSSGSQPQVAWDPTSGRIDDDAFEGVDAVLHLAGEPIAARRWSHEQKQRIADSRLQGTSLLADALAGLDDPPAVLVSASAIGFYGDRGDERLTEESARGDGFLAEVCAGWEAATESAGRAGIRVVLARTGVVLSPDGGALAEMLPFFRLGLGGRVGRGDQWMSWITLHDEVEALVWLIEAADAQITGPVNLTAPEPVTNRQFAAALGRALRRPAFLPAPKLALSARVGRELAEALLYSSARVEPAVLERNGFSFAHRNISEALSALV